MIIVDSKIPVGWRSPLRNIFSRWCYSWLYGGQFKSWFPWWKWCFDCLSSGYSMASWKVHHLYPFILDFPSYFPCIFRDVPVFNCHAWWPEGNLSFNLPPWDPTGEPRTRRSTSPPVLTSYWCRCAAGAGSNICWLRCRRGTGRIVQGFSENGWNILEHGSRMIKVEFAENPKWYSYWNASVIDVIQVEIHSDVWAFSQKPRVPAFFMFP